jgi:hypothetical protein
MPLISKKVAYFAIITMAFVIGYKCSDIPKIMEFAKPLDCNITSFNSGLNKTLHDVGSKQCNLKVTIDKDYISYPIGDAIIQIHIAQVIRHNNLVQEKEPFAHVNELKIHTYNSKQLNDELMGKYDHGVVQLRLSSDGVVLTHELNHAIHYGSMKREFMQGRFYSQFTNSLGSVDAINSITHKDYANKLYGYSGFTDSKMNRYNEFWAYGSEYLHYPTRLIMPKTQFNLTKLKAYADKNIKKGFYTSEAINKYNLAIVDTFDNLTTCSPIVYYKHTIECIQSSEAKLDSLNKLFNMLLNANPDFGLQQPNYVIIAFAIIYCILEMLLYFMIGYICFALSEVKRK